MAEGIPRGIQRTVQYPYEKKEVGRCKCGPNMYGAGPGETGFGGLGGVSCDAELGDTEDLPYPPSQEVVIIADW